MTEEKKVIVEDYSPLWPLAFEKLKAIYEIHVGYLSLDIQHVGSTSVKGLSAKPILDIDIIIESREILKEIISKLEKLGYNYIGDLGVKDREAFKRHPDKNLPNEIDLIKQKHNLYVCIKDSLCLQNHLQFRDHLRKNPEKAKIYGELKKRFAKENPFDINIYVQKKTPFILETLKETGFNDEALEFIAGVNRT